MSNDVVVVLSTLFILSGVAISSRGEKGRFASAVLSLIATGLLVYGTIVNVALPYFFP